MDQQGMGQENSEKRNDCELLDCQLCTLYDSTEDMDSLAELRRFYLRLKSAGGRRISRVRRKFFPIRQKQTNESRPNIIAHNNPVLQEGDLVEVLPFEDILKTLDENMCVGKTLFLDGMKQYCGKRLRVMKKLRTMIDEQSWGMVRLKDSVILKDAICDAKGQYAKEGCDRCCFYFWKEQWLRKVDE
jgi:hypothetical protein